MNKIRDNLFLSSYRGVTASEVKRHGITAILNVSNEVRTPKISGIELVQSAFKDNSLDALRHQEAARDALVDLLDTGHIVLVHCRAGASRSPHIVAFTLSMIEDRDYHEMYSEIRVLHPRAMEYSIGREIENNFPVWAHVLKRG